MRFARVFKAHTSHGSMQDRNSCVMLDSSLFREVMIITRPSSNSQNLVCIFSYGGKLTDTVITTMFVFFF